MLFFVVTFFFCRRDAFLNKTWFHASMPGKLELFFFSWPRFAYCFLFSGTFANAYSVTTNETDGFMTPKHQNPFQIAERLSLSTREKKKGEKKTNDFFFLINRFEMVWWHFHNCPFCFILMIYFVNTMSVSFRFIDAIKSHSLPTEFIWLIIEKETNHLSWQKCFFRRRNLGG